MSTRSNIIVQRRDGKFYEQYCHSDGYVESPGVGATLLKHYQAPNKILGLSKLGDLSILEASIEKPPGHTFDSKVKGHTVAYHRDRGGENGKWADCKPRVSATLDEATGGSSGDKVHGYVYVHTQGSWWLWEEGKLSPLDVAVAEADAAEAARLAAKKKEPVPA